MKNKNTYDNTDITDSGAKKHMSGIHNRCVRTNQYIWDMMKVLDKEKMYGFHFQTKVGSQKIMVILHHEDKVALDKAQKILKNVAKNSDILFLIKLKEKKEYGRIWIIAFITIFVSIIVIFIVSFFYKQGYLDSMIERLQSEEMVQEYKDEIEVDQEKPMVEEIVVDIEKLKLLKESFDEDNATSLSPDAMKALTMTTGIVSELVSEEEKAKYSTEALVKNFKGKNGFKLVLKDNNGSKDFNNTVEELNGYAMNFVKDNNLSEALVFYDKVSKEDNITKKEAMISSYNKAEIFEEMGLNKEAVNAYGDALKFGQALKDNNLSEAFAYYNEIFQEENLSKEGGMLSFFNQAEIFEQMELNKEGSSGYSNILKFREALNDTNQTIDVLNELVNMGQLAQLHQDLNQTKQAEEIRKRAQNLYKLLIIELKSYGDLKSGELAFALNYLANFYADNNENLLSVEIRKESLMIYEKLLKKEYKKFAFTYYKTLNSQSESYLKIKKIELAKKNYEKALVLMEKLVKSKIVKNKAYIALSYRALAIVEIKFENLKKAKEYYLNALKIYSSLEKKDISYTFQITDMHGEFAALYALEKKFKLAGEEYQKGVFKFIQMNKEIPLKYNLEIAKLLNASAFMKMSNYDMNSTEVLQARIELRESRKWGTKVLEINFKKAKKSIAKSYAYLAYIAGMNKNMELALEYYKISYALEKIKGVKEFRLLKLDFH